MRATLDGKPLSFEHGVFGYRQGTDSTIALFSSASAPDGIHHPVDPTCAEVLGTTTADEVEITAVDGEPRGGLVAYSFSNPLASGIASYLPGTRCADGSPCNQIAAEVVKEPTGVGATMAICTSAVVHVTDSDRVAHVLTIDGRIEGPYCGIKP